MLCIMSISSFALDWVSYSASLEISKKECKPVMLVVYNDGCSACESLFRGIKQSKMLNSILADYVVAKISAQEALAVYGTRVEVTPTIYLMGSDTKELLPQIDGLPGVHDEFISYLLHGIIVHEKVGCENNTKTQKK